MIKSAVALLVICIQFGAIIYFMDRAGKQEHQLAVMREELVDWEQISATYRRSAARFALSSEKCLALVKTYQASIFQPVEMNK